MNTYFTNDGARKAQGTDWAINNNGYSNATLNVDGAGYGYWWLRSPSTYSIVNVWIVSNSDGSLGVNVTTDALIGLRPAFKLDRDSVLFASDASGANTKSSAAAGGALVAAQPTAQNLKLTVKDSGMATPTLTFAGTTNGTNELRFGYTGAETGTNQYVSCILVDSGGDVAYYGKLADCAASGNGTLAIPLSGVTPDIYTLKIFSEQVNGDYYTDFASTSVNMTLTVDVSNDGTVTGAPSTDSTAPTVSGVTPSGTSAATSGNIAITFSEAMNTAAGIGSVALSGGAGTVSASGAWSNGNKTYTVGYSGLAYSTPYAIGISGFQDMAGNIMAADNTKTFTTAAASSGGGGGSSSGGSSAPQTPAYKLVTIRNLNGGSIGSFDTTGTISGGIMSIKPSAQSDVYVFGFNLLRLSELESANNGGKFRITLPGLEYELPFNMTNIITGLTDFLGSANSKEYTLELTIKKLTGDDLTKAQEAFKKAYPDGEVPEDFYDISFALYKNGSKVDFDANQFDSAMVFSLVTAEKCNAVFKYDAATGKFNFVPAKFTDTKAAAKTKTHSVYVAAQNSVTFPDVKAGAWYEPFIIGEANKGLVEGNQGLFRPDAEVTRAEFVQMIVNAMQLPVAKADTKEYDDVTNKNVWYYSAVMSARSAGLLDGFTDADFKPNQAITREEMASVLAAVLRQNNVPTTMQMIYLDQTFADYADMDKNYLLDIELVYRVKLMQGVGGNRFDSKGVTTRAQAATVQMRLLEILDMIDTGDK